MSTTSTTPPATRRIAKSYLTDLVAAIPAPSDGAEHWSVTAVVEQLLELADVRHVLKTGRLVLTFDLADDPAERSTSPAAQQGTAAGLDGHPMSAADSEAHAVAAADLENREYPGQPGERIVHGQPGEALPPLPDSAYPTDAVALEER